MARVLKNSGLSLVETIFSLFLLSSVTLLLFNLYPSSLASIGRSDQTVRGDEVAQSVLDLRQALAFPALTLNYSQDLPGETWGGILYTPHLEIFAIPNRDPNLLRGLRVTVHWKVKDQPRLSRHEIWVSNVTR